MRMRFGRPDLDAYAARFDVPAATGAFSVTFLGVSSLLFDDGEAAVLFDGFFSRPSLRKVVLGKVAPDTARIGAALARVGLARVEPTQIGLEGRVGGGRLAAVVPVHTHFDHALDCAVVARRTGARLIGGESAANIGRGHGLPTDQIVVVGANEQVACGAFTLTFVESRHCPPDRFPGMISRPVVPPVRASAYRCGQAWSVLLRHASGRTALMQGSAGYVPGALDGHAAQVVYLGVGQLGLQHEDYRRAYWAQTVQAVAASRVVLTHWDDFFRSLALPLRALPFAGDDLDVTMRQFCDLAEDQGVGLHLPTLWRREDPWTGLRQRANG
ncbi:MAG TPA: hypothetical protein VF163_17000 [Micromonosporaceae bacterium]